MSCQSVFGREGGLTMPPARKNMVASASKAKGTNQGMAARKTAASPTAASIKPKAPAKELYFWAVLTLLSNEQNAASTEPVGFLQYSTKGSKSPISFTARPKTITLKRTWG